MRYALLETAIPCRIMLADNYWLRLRGLLGRKLGADEGLLLSPCRRIHTFFMGYAIDAVYLDEQYRILRIDREIAPGRCLPGEKRACRVLELPANAAARLGLEPGAPVSMSKE